MSIDSLLHSLMFEVAEFAGIERSTTTTSSSNPSSGAEVTQGATQPNGDRRVTPVTSNGEQGLPVKSFLDVPCTHATSVTSPSRKSVCETRSANSPTAVYSPEWVSIRLWLALIGEESTTVIEGIYEKFVSDQRARSYLIQQAEIKAMFLDGIAPSSDLSAEHSH